MSMGLLRLHHVGISWEYPHITTVISIHAASLRQWTWEDKNMSSWRAMGSSSSVRLHLFGCDVARGALLVVDSKDSKVSMVSTWIRGLSIPNSGRLVWSNPSVCRLWVRYQQHRLRSLQISPSESFWHRMAEEKQTLAIYNSHFP